MRLLVDQEDRHVVVDLLVRVFRATEALINVPVLEDQARNKRNRDTENLERYAAEVNHGYVASARGAITKQRLERFFKGDRLGFLAKKEVQSTVVDLVLQAIYEVSQLPVEAALCQLRLASLFFITGGVYFTRIDVFRILSLCLLEHLSYIEQDRRIQVNLLLISVRPSEFFSAIFDNRFLENIALVVVIGFRV